MKGAQPKSIAEYIAGFPDDVKVPLEAIRDAIRKVAPEAEETIKYAMPTFVLNGNLVHFAAFKKHIGLYPVPRGVAGFEQLDEYGGDKSTMHLPLDKELPLALITKVVKYQARRNAEKVKAKTAAKKEAKQ